MITEFQSEQVHWYYKPGRSDWLLVTFNALNVGVNGNRFWGDNFAKKNNVSALGIITTGADWFPKAAMAPAIAALQPVLAKYKNVVTYGISMGGYGAIKYSSALGASTVVAFSPQFTIDPSRALPDDERYVNYFSPDLHSDVTIVRDDLPEAGRTYIFYDPYFREDTFCATQIARLDASVQPVPVFLTGHTSIQPFAKDNRALDIIEACRRGDANALRARVQAGRRAFMMRPHALACRIVRNHWRTALALYDRFLPQADGVRMNEFAQACDQAGRIGEAVDWAQRHVDSDRTRASYRHLLAIMMKVQGRFDRADEEIATAIDLEPANEEQVRESAWIRLERGDGPGAVDIMREAIARFPTRVHNHVGLIQVHDRLGDYEAAAEACAYAVTCFPANASLPRLFDMYAKAAVDPKTQLMLSSRWQNRAAA